MPVKPSTLIVAAFIMMFIGGLILVTTAYQQVEEYKEVEQPHMTPLVKQRVVWKTKAPILSIVGAVLLGVGVVVFVLLLVLVYMEDLT